MKRMKEMKVVGYTERAPLLPAGCGWSEFWTGLTGLHRIRMRGGVVNDLRHEPRNGMAGDCWADVPSVGKGVLCPSFSLRQGYG